VTNAGVFSRLTALEVLLHQPEVRSDHQQLAALLHPAFFEFGRSGRVWTRQEVLEEFTGNAATPHAQIHAQDFALQTLADDVALLTYRSAHCDADGVLSRWTLRSSLWQRVNGAWLMRFHQGTPFAA
jgi:hypothetical protein